VHVVCGVRAGEFYAVAPVGRERVGVVCGVSGLVPDAGSSVEDVSILAATWLSGDRRPTGPARREPARDSSFEL